MNETSFAGFWRRAAADFIDAVLLGLFGSFLGIFFAKQFSAMGNNGLWIGFIICVLYYGLLHTRLGNGQTLGKRILKIQVLSMTGKPLTFGPSLGRYLVLAMVLYNGLYVQFLSYLPKFLMPITSVLAGVALLAGFLGCYLLIVLHPLKRGLHDLAAGSVVVRSGEFDLDELKRRNSPTKQQHAFRLLLAYISICILLVAGGMFVIYRQIGGMADQNSIFQKLNGSFDVRSTNETRFNGGQPSLLVTVFQPEQDYDDKQLREDLRAKVAQRLLKGDIDLSKYKEVKISVASGYSIGIVNINTNSVGDDILISDGKGNSGMAAGAVKIVPK